MNVRNAGTKRGRVLSLYLVLCEGRMVGMVDMVGMVR